MEDQEHKNNRITLERITVTTVRRRDGDPVYCAMCRNEIDAIRSAIEFDETNLLVANDEPV